MSEKNYYQVLEVDASASENDIKKAYYALSRKKHPDKFTRLKAKAVERGADAEELGVWDERITQADVEMKELNEAYEVLSDATKRVVYDRKLKTQQTQSTYAPPPPEIVVILDFLFFRKMKRGESKSGYVQIQNNGGPVEGEISFSLQEDVDWLEIEFTATPATVFPIKLKVTVDATDCKAGTHTAVILFEAGTAGIHEIEVTMEVLPPPEEDEEEEEPEYREQKKIVHNKHEKSKPTIHTIQLIVGVTLTLLFLLLFTEFEKTPQGQALLASILPGRHLLVSGEGVDLICRVAWSPEGRYFSYSFSRSGTENNDYEPVWYTSTQQILRIADAQTGETMWEINEEMASFPTFIFSPDGEYLAILTQREKVGSASLVVEIFIKVISTQTGMTIDIHTESIMDITEQELASTRPLLSLSGYNIRWSDQPGIFMVHQWNIPEDYIAFQIHETSLSILESSSPLSVGHPSNFSYSSSLRWPPDFLLSSSGCWEDSPDRKSTFYISTNGSRYLYRP